VCESILRRIQDFFVVRRPLLEVRLSVRACVPLRSTCNSVCACVPLRSVVLRSLKGGLTGNVRLSICTVPHCGSCGTLMFGRLLLQTVPLCLRIASDDVGWGANSNCCVLSSNRGSLLFERLPLRAVPHCLRIMAP